MMANCAFFGLGAPEYLHSTAPNRRFPDLVTQRLLKDAEHSGGSSYSDEELTAIARHCTLQEDNAAKVDGVKVSLLVASHEVALRAALPEGVRLYTGDDFNYPDLIAGDYTLLLPDGARRVTIDGGAVTEIAWGETAH